MASQSNVTTDHKEIMNWVKKRNGKPARVRGTGGASDPGLLRINFPGNDNGNLQNISWDEFFNKFEEEELAFLYQEATADGEPSYFNKLVSRRQENR